MNTTLCAIGTRPEAVKMAPVIAEFKRRRVPHTVVSTGQHRELVRNTLNDFDLKADIDLNIMSKDQTPTQVAARVLTEISGVLTQVKPDWMVVQGDTTTVMAASIAGAYQKVQVAHVEAGLRTGNKQHPFPEELNRVIAGRIADLHFAPTAKARDNLLREGVPANTVYLTGNTVVDALHWARTILNTRSEGATLPSYQPMAAQDPTKRLILLTAHRRESFGPPLVEALRAIRRISLERTDIEVLYPVHPNPAVREPAHEVLGDLSNVFLVEPLDYFGLVQALDRSAIVVTDSGGLQEEAPALAKPVLILRETTERPEAVDAGVARLVGTDGERIYTEISTLLDNDDTYAEMARGASPYGDGRAAKRIVSAILNEPFEDFVPE